MKVVPSNAITAIICLGQSFLANQSIPTTFLSRIQTVTSFLLERFTTPDPRREVKSLPDFLILSGSDVKNNGITEARFMLDQINERLEVSKLINPLTTWNLTTDQNSQSYHQTSLKVILEEESRNTLENILYCYEILEKYNINKIYLVTSDFHIFRSFLLTKMIWSQSNDSIKREVIPVIAHSHTLPRNNQLISNNPKILQSLKSFVSRITSLFSFLIKPKAFIQPHTSKQMVNTCTIDQLQSHYRPWEHRPKDISEWTIMEKLDLEKKAILSMQENFRKYPKLAHLTIPQDDIQRTLDDLHRFNETLIQQYTHHTSSNSSAKTQMKPVSCDLPQSSSFLSSLLSTTSSFVTSLS